MARECAIEYRTLRDYVKNVLGNTSTVIEGEIAERLNLSDKTIQLVCAGKRCFSWSEAKKVADYFIEKTKDSAEPTVFHSLLFAFLKACCNDDEITDDIIRKLIDKDYIVSIDNDKIVYHYSNLPETHNGGSIIRSSIVNQISSSIQKNDIVFLSGFTGTGKSYVANHVAHEQYEKCTALNKVAIWNDCSSGNMSLNSLISNILSAFDLKNSGNLSREEKEKYAKKFLADNNAIIVVDEFEHIEDENEKKEIIAFLEDIVSDKTIILITCKERLNYYRDMIERSHLFDEIRIDKFNPEEWRKLAKIYIDSRDDISTVVKELPTLVDDIYKMCKGNAYLMTHVLAAITEKIMNGFNYAKIRKQYHLSDVDPQSYHKVLKKSLNDLSDNCKILLVTLSLFSTQVSLPTISIVSGLKGVDDDGDLIEKSDLAVSLLNCHNLFLVDRSPVNTKAKFSIPIMPRTIIENVREDNSAKYKQIIDRWIDYYKDFTSEIGFCFDDFDKLSKLDDDSADKEIDNIISLLEYCENEGKWKDFYIISERTKYYFYTHGISGEGRDSIHYKRAIAARNINDKKAEFEALLYHCNVSCKAKSLESLEECFARIEELLKTESDIPNDWILKYTYLKALYWFSIDETTKAIEVFDEYEKCIKSKIDMDNPIKDKKMQIHDYVASLRWHCECLYKCLENHSYDETESANIVKTIDAMLDDVIKLSKPINFERAIVHSQLTRMKAYLFVGESLDKIDDIYQSLNAYMKVVENDAMYKSEYDVLKKRYEDSLRANHDK